MHFGICPLSVVPVWHSPQHESHLTTQLLYGDFFKVLERRKNHSRIRITYDGIEGWIDNDQYVLCSKDEHDTLTETKERKHCSDLVSHVCKNQNNLMPIVLGSNMAATQILGHSFEGNLHDGTPSKSNLVQTALLYLNAPFMEGGKTPFGIDSPGLTQMVYKINRLCLKRSAEEQSKQGEALSFIEESEPGDLAFFDDKEGIINHVGIILKDNYIINASGQVRIDRIDHTGIFNSEEKMYSHKLRVIKKII